MGVTGGNPDEIQRSGKMFQDIPVNEPPLAPPPLFGGDGPLSAGLASVQNHMAYTAADFADAKDRGIDTAGRALQQIGTNVADFDRQNAETIRQLMPDQPPPDQVPADPAPGADGGP
jgi:hypothetical protein